MQTSSSMTTMPSSGRLVSAPEPHAATQGGSRSASSRAGRGSAVARDTRPPRVSRRAGTPCRPAGRADPGRPPGTPGTPCRSAGRSRSRGGRNVPQPPVPSPALRERGDEWPVVTGTASLSGRGPRSFRGRMQTGHGGSYALTPGFGLPPLHRVERGSGGEAPLAERDTSLSTSTSPVWVVDPLAQALARGLVSTFARRPVHAVGARLVPIPWERDDARHHPLGACAPTTTAPRSFQTRTESPAAIPRGAASGARAAPRG